MVGISFFYRGLFCPACAPARRRGVLGRARLTSGGQGCCCCCCCWGAVLAVLCHRQGQHSAVSPRAGGGPITMNGL